ERGGHVRLHQAGGDDEHWDLPFQLAGERLAEAPHGGLAGRVGAVRTAGQVRRAAAGDHDPAAAALEHPGDDRSTTEVDAQDVHFEDVPPLVWVDLPGLAGGSFDAGVRDQEVDLANLGDPALDVLPPRDVADERAAADLRGDGFDLLRGSRGDHDLHARGRQLVRDARADPAPAA